jgi:CheY-like chemotaxis protein
VFIEAAAMGDNQVNNVKYAKGSKGLIFVVDDEPMLLELAAVILEPLGYSVKTFRDPQSALKSYADAKPRPALIITDFAMHRMNGLELLEACRRLHPEQRILMISGTVDETIYRNSPSKPDLFIAKPYHAKQLVQAVRQLVARQNEKQNGD